MALFVTTRGLTGRWSMALLAAAILGGCSNNSQATLSQQAKAWSTQAHFGQLEIALGRDLSQLKSTTKALDWGQAQLACVDVGTNASQIEGELPTPDKALTTTLDSAYSQYLAFASGCVKNKGHVTKAAEKSLAAANSYLALAERRYSAILNS